MTQLVDKFKEITSNLNRKIDFTRWPSSVFFFNGDKWMFEYDIISGILYCRYDMVWKVLEEASSLRYGGIQMFIKNQVEEHFKTKEITPSLHSGSFSHVVEEHFKTKEITPTIQMQRFESTVDEHFKTKEIKPSKINWRTDMVEEHFKTREVTPVTGISLFSYMAEKHFKTKEITPSHPPVVPSGLVDEHSKTKEVRPSGISTYNTEVEAHFKIKEITPVWKRYVKDPVNVEKHFKPKEVTPHGIYKNDILKVEDHFKIKKVTPRYSPASTLVEEHFKTKEVTPRSVRSFIQNTVVEEHFKIKEVTPGFLIRFNISKVEEHFKPKEVIPDCFAPDTAIQVEEHFKSDEAAKKDTLMELMPIGCIYDNGMPHHTQIPALYFSNGECYFYYRGVYISHELFYKLKDNKVTFEEWAAEQNEEVKSAILAYIEEVHGADALYRFISSYLKEVDTYVDKKDEKYLEGTTGGMNIGVYTLFKGEIKGISLSKSKNISLAYVRCYCPSTDRMFFLGVDSKNNNAKDAIASRYKIPKKLAPHIKNINRQGERFSTILTEEGKKIRRQMKKGEFADLVTISGDEYFSKMRYEY